MPAWHQAEAVGDESRALGEKDGQGFRLHFPVTHPFVEFVFALNFLMKCKLSVCGESLFFSLSLINLQMKLKTGQFSDFSYVVCKDERKSRYTWHF